MSIILKTTNLCKSFNGQTAVNNISLNIERNSVYGLLGPNGAGKSTTLKMITGILRPTSGSIEFDGHAWKRSDLNHIGALIEMPPLYENLTAYENLKVRTNFIIYILHLFLSFKFGLGLSLFWGVFESLQCILYSNIELKGLARYIPFAWSMNWVQDILSRQIFNYGTEKIWIAALTTGGLLLTLLWFSHWEGRKNYE